jgi:AraC family transcriptional regulator
VLDQIDAELAGALTVAALARTAGLSRFHFIRSFKQATGQSPYHYVLSQRVARARALLQSGDTPIEQIAISVGFSDHAQFSRAFRKLNGTTPRDFRKAARVRS